MYIKIYKRKIYGRKYVICIYIVYILYTCIYIYIYIYDLLYTK